MFNGQREMHVKKKQHTPILISITLGKGKKDVHVFRVYKGREMQVELKTPAETLGHEATIKELISFFEGERSE